MKHSRYWNNSTGYVLHVQLINFDNKMTKLYSSWPLARTWSSSFLALAFIQVFMYCLVLKHCVGDLVGSGVMAAITLMPLA